MTQQQTSDNGQPGGHQVIRTDSELKKRAVRPGTEGEGERDAIARAEKALDELSVNFDDWMKIETDRLCEARDAAVTATYASADLEQFYQAAHNLKGQASTLGYPFADEICASLCRLLDKTNDKSRIPTVLVNQHVDAVRALVKEQIKGPENPKASILVKRLRDVTDDFVSQQIKNRSAA